MGLRKGLKAEDLRRCSRTLMLMRHAKTERQGSQGDRGRQLTDRGQKQARIMGRGLSALGLVPDRIICSGAPRARQTLDGMLKPLGTGRGSITGNPSMNPACRRSSTSWRRPRTVTAGSSS